MNVLCRLKSRGLVTNKQARHDSRRLFWRSIMKTFIYLEMSLAIDYYSGKREITMAQGLSNSAVAMTQTIVIVFGQILTQI